MKIVHAIAGAKVGGAETFAQDAILSLHARDLAQVVFTRPYEQVMRRYRDAGVRAVPLAYSLIDRLLGRGREIREMARAEQADLVHAWMSRANRFIPAGMSCPVIGWFGDYYDLKYYRQADFYFCVTPDISRHVAAAGARPHRVVTVNTFGTMPDAAPVERAEFDTPADAPVLLVLSRMHTVKGIDTMLQALTQVRGAYLWLAGDGPERVAYEALATRLGLAERVRFLGWRNDRKALLAASDICVLPSRYEPFGTVIIEAWAMRRPLVATLAAGARQYVTDGQTGLLCPIDDSSALAACLNRVITDGELRRGMAERAFVAYEADFTRTIVTDRLIEAYERCLRLGPVERDTTQIVADLDQSRIGFVTAGLAAPGIAQARIRATVEVALAYAVRAEPMAPDALRRLISDAALLQAAGLCHLLIGSGWQRRVLVLPRAELDHAF
jgi:glycosyltransferase involved in cell wall biosynthesis